MRKKGLILLPSLVLIFALTLGMAANVSANPTSFETVAEGLNNPRGLAFSPNGDLFVAEAGFGGEGPCGPGPEGERCYGDSGSITRIDLKKGTQEYAVTGLPSLAGEDGARAIGPHDISFQGTGNAYITIGFGGHPDDREEYFGEAGADFGQLARMTASGNFWNVSDLGTYEADNNPTGDEEDTNPYGVLALPGKQVVTDAGANDLLEIAANGEISYLATFPNALGTPQVVPTTVALGPDGDYYVGQLTGFPFPVGGANVFRVPAEGGDPVVFASGFTNIIDIEFGPDGSLYVLEIAKNGLLAAFILGDWTGALIRVAPDGSQTELGTEELFAPGGVAFGPDGMLYVTNNSILPGAGQVLRIQP